MKNKKSMDNQNKKRTIQEKIIPLKPHQFKKGNIPWNKNNSKRHYEDFNQEDKNLIARLYTDDEYCSLTKIAKQFNTSRFAIGKIIDNFGIKHKTRNQLYSNGHNPFKNKHHTQETRNKLRKCRLRQRFINKDTRIEKYVEKILVLLNTEYKKQYNLLDKYVVDFYIPTYKTIIECDGDYWHNYPDGTERDALKTKELQDAGYRVFRFWESNLKQHNTLLEDMLGFKFGFQREVFEV